MGLGRPPGARHGTPRRAACFADPVAAFTNLAGASRPGARLVMMVWQSHDRNEWATEVDRALTGGAAALGTEPFSLGDPSVVEGVLTTAGFADMALAETREPVYYGPEAEFAYQLVLSFGSTGDHLASLDPAGRQRALERLRDLLAARENSDGVWFDSRAWIVTARAG